MVTKYVWWDDVERHERSRLDVRLPKALHAFLAAVAKTHGVSVNGLVVGILAYAADSDARRRLRVEVVPGVRVTESGPGSDPVTVPVPPASAAVLKRWETPKVL